MQWSNLAHGNTIMHLEAFQDGGIRPTSRTIEPELAQVVVVKLGVKEFGLFMTPTDPEIVYRVQERSFCAPLAHFMQPQVRGQTVSFIISHINLSDASAVHFWKDTVSFFSFQAAQLARLSGIRRLVVKVDIHIHTHYPAMNLWRSLVAEEIDEVLILSLDDANNIGRGEDQFGGVPASMSSIKKLTTSRFGAGGDTFQQKECVICFEDFEPGMEVTRMPCSHVFHGHCLIQWLERSRLCPLCRFELPSTDSAQELL